MNTVYRVIIAGKRTGQLWNSYELRADADLVCAKLRAWGMDARVVEPDDVALHGEQVSRSEPTP